MRKTLIASALVLAGLSVPLAASADPYRCRNDNNDQVTGAIVGGLIGGLLGSSAADHGSKTSGTIIGGALGAAAGAAIADGGDGCDYGYRDRYSSGVRTSYSIGVSSGYGGYGGYNTYYGGYSQPRYVHRPGYRPAPPVRHHDRGRAHYRPQSYTGSTYYGGSYIAPNTGGTQVSATISNQGSAFVIAAGHTRPTTCRSSVRRIQNWDGSYREVYGQECLTVSGGYRPYGF